MPLEAKFFPIMCRSYPELLRPQQGAVGPSDPTPPQASAHVSGTGPGGGDQEILSQARTLHLPGLGTMPTVTQLTGGRARFPARSACFKAPNLLPMFLSWSKGQRLQGGPGSICRDVHTQHSVMGEHHLSPQPRQISRRQRHWAQGETWEAH